uniref:Myb/SANT-like DNA-binding domain-containing protein n=1 Tax=Araucaria cunninghamii TaxID=56994 RepID=A0A0D6R2W5_ARACU
MASDDDEFRKANLGSRAEWHPDTVARLIDGYGEKCANIKGYLKTKDWEEIVKYVNIQCEGSKVPKTMKQCREKIDSLKRRYKLEKRRAEIRGSNHVNWSFFDKLDDIMRNLRRSGNISEGQSFEVAEALDFEGFDGDNRSDLMISSKNVGDNGNKGTSP